MRTVKIRMVGRTSIKWICPHCKSINFLEVFKIPGGRKYKCQWCHQVCIGTRESREKSMTEMKAVDLADRFPEWVGDLLRESAEGARDTLRWFIKTLYSKGYQIKKKEK